MAFIGYDKLWKSDFYNNQGAKDRVQDTRLNQLKLKVNETYQKDLKKTTTNFYLINKEDVTNTTYLDTK